jgi:hypothetical protein
MAIAALITRQAIYRRPLLKSMRQRRALAKLYPSSESSAGGGLIHVIENRCPFVISEYRAVFGER